MGEAKIMQNSFGKTSKNDKISKNTHIKVIL